MRAKLEWAGLLASTLLGFVVCIAIFGSYRPAAGGALGGAVMWMSAARRW